MDIVGLLIDKLGLGAGLVFGFLIILWLTSKTIVNRLFNEHNGIFTLIANEHVSVMKKIADTQVEQHIDIVEVKKNLRELLMLHKSGSSHLSNKKLHESAIIACDVLEDLIEALDENIDVTEKLRQIKMILSRDDG